MNNIKTEFSIKDLENLSGVKAHTIRIWEKRYNLLEPNRTKTNIRTYNIENLQKLLNVVYLNHNGYKISKISQLKPNDIPRIVRELGIGGNQEEHSVNALKMAMLNFDQELFNTTYNFLLQSNSFKDIFYSVFIGLLEEIGLLWQTDTISPAHEHFITTLIKQKILINIEKAQQLQSENSPTTYVLFLPENEIHDIGLLFINYELVCRGHHAIYLGQSVPQNCLKDFTSLYDNLVYISYFTVKPEIVDLEHYVTDFKSNLLKNKNHKFLILGQRSKALDRNSFNNNIRTYSSISDLVKEM